MLPCCGSSRQEEKKTIPDKVVANAVETKLNIESKEVQGEPTTNTLWRTGSGIETSNAPGNEESYHPELKEIEEVSAVEEEKETTASEFAPTLVAPKRTEEQDFFADLGLDGPSSSEAPASKPSSTSSASDQMAALMASAKSKQEQN